jgi:hypothetical protein
VVDRVVPAQLACRIGARARAGERDAWPANVEGGLALFVSTLKLPFAAIPAAARKELSCPTRL